MQISRLILKNVQSIQSNLWIYFRWINKKKCLLKKYFAWFEILLMYSALDQTAQLNASIIDRKKEKQWKMDCNGYWNIGKRFLGH